MEFIDVINLWPNAPALAQDLTGIRAEPVSKNCVYKWRNQNRIPPDYWKDLIEAGKNRGLNITSDMLVECAAKEAA